ncbi:MAG: type IV pilus assembly protein PilM [Candidatus Paceibacterales bacterium]
MRFLKLIPKKFLGIDIGTFAIKIAELSSWARRIKLENYGEIPASALYQRPFRTFEKSTLLLSTEDIARAIKAVLEEAKIKSRECVFSIPDFSTFFTTFELPGMTAEELPQAIRAEARKHVPIPLGEVTLDWQLIGGKVSDQRDTELKILLVAVPNEVINQYQKIALISDLKLLALEAEVFGLVRALIEEEKRTIGLIDIGARSTTCSIIDKRILKISHSFDISGSDLTERIAKGLSVDYERAEVLKKKYGISTSPQLGLEGEHVREILIPLIGLIIRESEKIFKNFYLKEGKEIEKIIIAGGTVLLPGLLEYFQKYFKKEVEIANPFSKIFYPPILEKTLKEIGPSYAIAVGVALRGLE